MRVRTQLVVVGVVVVAMVAGVVGYAILTAPVGQPCGTLGCCESPVCGLRFALGNPSNATLCTGVSTPTEGCLAAGDYFYRVMVEVSTITIGEVLFKVENASGETYFATPDGGFDILDGLGHIVAAFNLSSGGPLSIPNATNWTYATGVPVASSTSPIPTTDSIDVDMGSVNPAGRGDRLAAISTGLVPGFIALLSLP